MNSEDNVLGGCILAFFIVLILLYWFLCKCVIIVAQGTAVIVERFGRFYKKCDAGYHVLIPFVDVPRRVIWRTFLVDESSSGFYQESFSYNLDLRQTIFDLPIQQIITRDNVTISVHPMMLVKVTDPVRVAYETYDLMEAVERLVQTSLRSVIGDMGLDDTLASRQEIEKLVSNKVCKICQDWGLTVSGVDLLEIDPTPTIQKAMHEQIRAERYRRTQKVTAEGMAEKLRLQAEGNCQAAKTRATGDSTSVKSIAEGNRNARLIIAEKTAESLNVVADALKGVTKDPTQYLIGVQYVNMLREIAKKAKAVTVYLPLETDIGGIASKL